MPGGWRGFWLVGLLVVAGVVAPLPSMVVFLFFGGWRLERGELRYQ